MCSRSIELTVRPSEALIDETVEISVSGLSPAEPVRIETRFEDEGGVVWVAEGLYYADPTGVVDPARCASFGGTYRGLCDRGLFWSPLPEGAGSREAYWRRSATDESARLDRPMEEKAVARHYTVRVSAGADRSAEATVTRFLTAPDVAVEEVTDGRLRGAFYTPPGDGPHPGVLVLTGSLGGADRHVAGYLASKGFATFALGYFRYADRPTSLSNIDLEYFVEAIEWMRNRLGHDRTGVYGISYGAEAAMLTAAHFPELVKAVIANVPSHMNTSGTDDNAMLGVPGWLKDGAALPYAMPKAELVMAAVAEQKSKGAEASLRSAPAFMAAWDDPANEDAIIPIENADCPIMAISGEGDGLWPSAVAGERIGERLKAKGYAHPYRHLSYPGAGHGLFPPNYPCGLTSRLFHVPMGFFMESGGLPQYSADAMWDMWPKIVDFLKDSLA